MSCGHSRVVIRHQLKNFRTSWRLHQNSLSINFLNWGHRHCLSNYHPRFQCVFSLHVRILENTLISLKSSTTSCIYLLTYHYLLWYSSSVSAMELCLSQIHVSIVHLQNSNASLLLNYWKVLRICCRGHCIVHKSPFKLTLSFAWSISSWKQNIVLTFVFECSNSHSINIFPTFKYFQI